MLHAKVTHVMFISAMYEPFKFRNTCVECVWSKNKFENDMQKIIIRETS